MTIIIFRMVGRIRTGMSIGMAAVMYTAQMTLAPAKEHP